MISSADRRSFSQVSYLLTCAVREARHGNAFGAGKYIGMADMGAAVIDDNDARNRAEWLVLVMTTVAQDGIEKALFLHAFDTYTMAA